MGGVEDLADELARDAIAAAKRLGDPGLIEKVSKTLGDTSTTTQEAYLTAVRVRLAAERARNFIEAQLAKAPKGVAVGPEIDISSLRIMNAADDGAGGH